MQLQVVHTHVFAAAPDGGNPCPVVLGADALSDDGMQRLARKFGLDTAFVLNPDTTAADLRIRYFVPDHEMGISGHATVAAVTVALAHRLLRSNKARLQTISGVYTVAYQRTADAWRVTVEQRPPEFGVCVDVEAAARALGIPSYEIDQRSSPIQVVSVSRPKLLVPLRSNDALERLMPDFESLWRLCDSIEASGLYPFTRRPDNTDAHAEARQFPLRAGFPEDAATGVAAAALGAYLTRYDLGSADGRHEFQVAQGRAMGCPSRIDALAECAQGRIFRTALRGTADILASERIVQRT